MALKSLLAKVAHGVCCGLVLEAVSRVMQLRQHSEGAGGCVVRVRGPGGRVSAVIAMVGQSNVDICEVYTT